MQPIKAALRCLERALSLETSPTLLVFDCFAFATGHDHKSGHWADAIDEERS